MHIYGNKIIYNNGTFGYYDPAKRQAYDDASAKYVNLWNSSTEGNYWSDYGGSGTYAIDGGSSVDEHPNDCATVPEFSAEIMIAVIITLGAVMLLRRKH